MAFLEQFLVAAAVLLAAAYLLRGLFHRPKKSTTRGSACSASCSCTAKIAVPKK
ncbi:MAG: hypothetical protein ACOYNG_08950 [Terrimicrobiaceae bacterium]